MESRERPAVAIFLPVPDGVGRLAVDDHADLTGHSGAYSYTARGWECAVCTNLASQHPYFRQPASGPPPSGYFEEWPAAGYTWRAEPPPYIDPDKGRPRPRGGYDSVLGGRRNGR